jgi:AraC family transcriptional regulator, regulatory protein of adaptative response / DNA-3-methyladenine glycosylase II
MELDPGLCRQALLSRDARFDGRFFVGVKTTGIYCRPICPARPPKAENCLFFASAAAAQQAGFRPCLRCRPETAPELGAWRGTSNTVSRALTLIDAGALDTQGVDSLADRLGIGARQLRRLFMRHFGASPLAVAQTRRVLLAKQLIHETDLSMAQVAHASGYGSVRRFNEIFQTLFGRPPASLRRARAAHIAADAPITLSLSYRPPYDWAAILGFFATRAIPGIEVVAGDVYHRTIELDGAVGTIAVAHQAERNRLRATIRFPRVAALPMIIARLRRMFDLGADPAVIGAVLSQDPVLAPLIAARPGLRVPGAWDAFELGVRAIAGQQITVGAATKLTGRIVEQCGVLLAGGATDQGLTHSFPPPSILAGATLGFMPAARAASIAGLAAAFVANPAVFERGADLDASVERLCGLAGIGPWTAHYIAMRALREPDAFPAADIGLLRAMDDGGGRPSPSGLLARAERWRPWRAYAALHLWAGGAAAAPAREATDALAA